MSTETKPDATLQALPSACISPELVNKIRRLRDALSAGLVERELVARLTLLALIAGEHIILFGPPGTAKSLVAQRIGMCVDDASTYFERLLTRFSVPEEIFGPLSIKALENDEYKRQISGYLPTAHFAFLDEIFKANSAILNSLLTILNERSFDNGSTRVGVPLRMVVGASNELPAEGELSALFDRFLLRVEVEPVSANGFGRLLELTENKFVIDREMKLTIADLDAIKEAADQVQIPAAVQNLLIRCREECIAKQIQVSDRRWRKVVKLLKVSAASNGRNEVSLWDCGLLEHCLWEKPKASMESGGISQREALQSWYAGAIGVAAPGAHIGKIQDIEIFLKAFAEEVTKLQVKRQKKDKDGNPLFLDSSNNPSISKTRRVPKSDIKGQKLFCVKTLLNNSCRIVAPLPLVNSSELTLKQLDQLEIQVLIPYYGWGNISSFRNWPGRDAYIIDPRAFVMVEESVPAMESNLVDSSFFNAKNAEISKIEAGLDYHVSALKAQQKSIASEVAGNLWASSELRFSVDASITDQCTHAVKLLAQARSIKTDFGKLPRTDSKSPVPHKQ